MDNYEDSNFAGDFSSSELRCLRGPAPALESEGNAEEPRMPALGLTSEGASTAAARRKAKRRSRFGRRRSGDGRPYSPIRYSSDHRSSSGNVDNGEAGGSVFSSTGRSVTDGGDHNDLVSIYNPFSVIFLLIKSIFGAIFA